MTAGSASVSKSVCLFPISGSLRHLSPPAHLHLAWTSLASDWLLTSSDYSQCLPPGSALPSGWGAGCPGTSTPQQPSQPQTPSTPPPSSGGSNNGGTTGQASGSCGAYSGDKTGYATTTVCPLSPLPFPKSNPHLPIHPSTHLPTSAQYSQLQQLTNFPPALLRQPKRRLWLRHLLRRLPLATQPGPQTPHRRRLLLPLRQRRLIDLVRSRMRYLL